MNNNYTPCFKGIDFVVIPSYIELPWSDTSLEPFILKKSPHKVFMILSAQIGRKNIFLRNKHFFKDLEFFSRIQNH